MTLDWTHAALAEGLNDYNAARYFEAHEAWESVWLTAPQPEKLFLQALIQTTVAMHHFTRGNLLGATRLLTAALRKLGPYPPDFARIDTALLRDDIGACLCILTGAAPGDLEVVILSAAKNPRICDGGNPSLANLTPPRIHLLSL
jgi:uncharacterized protein